MDRREIIGLKRRHLLNKGQPVDLVLAGSVVRRISSPKDYMLANIILARSVAVIGLVPVGINRSYPLYSRNVWVIFFVTLLCFMLYGCLPKLGKTSLCGNFLHTQIKTIVGVSWQWSRCSLALPTRNFFSNLIC